uniref:Uncharacterized protein n=1 Tax=viral metagenome TaxID=1070528 RepID=A0A6M3JI30_9ZZZZ
MRKFIKNKKLSGGTKSHPFYTEVGNLKCVECNVDAKIISKKKQSHTEHFTGRGALKTEWDVITWECPKCGNTEKEETGYSESDASYYSNEERRVYRIK